MNARTLFMPLAMLAVSWATPAPASAHRLDEYLQATRLSVDVDHVGLEIDLTAGVRIASDVFAWIDTDRDGRISNAEAEAYARQMLRSVVLSIDNLPAPIRLVEISVPPLEDMNQGVGTIRVRATADVSAAGSLRHRLTYVNLHRPESSVYLVNALVPTDPRLQLGNQRRDSAQHGLTLDYSISADASWARTWSLLTGLAMAVVLGATRRPRRKCTFEPGSLAMRPD
jgi:hypothetical protein